MKSLPHSFLLVSIITVAMVFSLKAEPVLFGNKAFSGQSLDDDTVKAILLGKKSTIGDTRVVIIIVRSSDNQEGFLSNHLGMTSGQFQTYWRRLYMTGGGSAPKVVDSETEALKLAADTAGGICIGDSAKADASIVQLAK